MKKIVLCLSIFLIAVSTIIGVFIKNTEKENTEYLRIHIRANSNSDTDQAVKYKVKEKVVEYLTPYIAELKTKEQAQTFLQNNLQNIDRVATEELLKNGFTYQAKSSVRKELFPTRVYEDLTLNSGFYDALIIELGTGTGDNWWCVVYPPLCFVSTSTKYIYKSKIKEIIDNFFNIRGE